MAVAGLASFLLFASAVLDGTLSGFVLLAVRFVLVGVGMVATSAAIHPGEAAHLGRTLRPLLLVALLPAAWLAIQAIPLPFATNPVWSSAAGALPTFTAAHITVDVSATISTLLQLLLTCFLAILAGAQALDRSRAERLLIGLAAAAILIPALTQCLHLIGADAGANERAAAASQFSIAALLALACGDLAYERHETRHANRADTRSRFLATEAGCLAVVICSLAVAGLLGGVLVLIAGASGLLVFISIVASRRFGWGPWFPTAVLVLVAFVFLSFVTNGFGAAPGLLVGRVPLNDLETRMFRDVPLVGTGGGTAPIYSNLFRTFDDVGSFVSSSAASKLSLELGAPVFWLIIVLSVVFEGVLVRDALRRGRDLVYSILGASFVPVAVVLCFADTGPLDWSVAAVGSGIIGLALVQGQSRSFR